MSSLVLKLSYNSELRRVPVDSTSLSFGSLVDICKNYFPSLDNLVITYMDDEDEAVRISSNEELREAISVSLNENRKTLKLELSTTTKTEKENPDMANLLQQILLTIGNTAQGSQERVRAMLAQHSKKNNEPKVVHRRVSCDMCGTSPIVGVRYKCCVRENFDICEQCEAVDNSLYPYIKIKTPEQAPAAIMTVMKENQPFGESSGDEAAFERFVNGDVTFGDVKKHGKHCLKKMLRRQRKQDKRQKKCDKNEDSKTCVPFKATDEMQEDRNETKTEEKAQVTAMEVDSQIENVTQVTEKMEINEEHECKQEESDLSLSISASLNNLAMSMSSISAVGSINSVKPNARFVNDMTVPDGSLLPLSCSFAKRWQMINDGESSFPKGCRLVNVGGDLLNGPISGVPIGEIAKGEIFEVFVELKTPSVMVNSHGNDRYIGYWRLQTAEGITFGHRLWVDIQVSNTTEELEDWSIVKNDSVDEVQTPIQVIQPTMEEVKKDTFVAPPPYTSVPPQPIFQPIFNQPTFQPIIQPVAQPPTIKIPKEFEGHIEQLHNMGFSNDDVNLILLEDNARSGKKGGDLLEAVINALIV